MDFVYKARSGNGDTMRGVHDALSEREVISWIRDNGWTPIEIKNSAGARRVLAKDQGAGKTSADSFFSTAPRVKLRDKLILFRQLSTMISAGVTVAGAIEILTEQTTNSRLRKVMKSVFTRVSSGITLANALAEHPSVFGTLDVSLVRSGEESGSLDTALNRLSGFIEAQEGLHKKIVSAMTYPAAVISILILIMGVMVTIVVPQFQKAFSGINIKMPKLTLALFAIGQWSQKNWYMIPLVIIAVIAVIKLLKNIKGLKFFFDSASLRIPIFGGVTYKACVSRSFRTMASLLKSGVPVLQTLELAGDVAGNEKIKRAFYTIRDAAAMGIPLNVVIREKKLFPPMISHMVAVGEETGRTDEMFAKIADWYESELEETVKRLSSLLEPVLIVVVGGVVAVMVLAIFLPIITAIHAFL